MNQAPGGGGAQGWQLHALGPAGPQASSLVNQAAWRWRVAYNGCAQRQPPWVHQALSREVHQALSREVHLGSRVSRIVASGGAAVFVLYYRGGA